MVVDTRFDQPAELALRCLERLSIRLDPSHHRPAELHPVVQERVIDEADFEAAEVMVVIVVGMQRGIEVVARRLQEKVQGDVASEGSQVMAEGEVAVIGAPVGLGQAEAGEADHHGGEEIEHVQPYLLAQVLTAFLRDGVIHDIPVDAHSAGMGAAGGIRRIRVAEGVDPRVHVHTGKVAGFDGLFHVVTLLHAFVATPRGAAHDVDQVLHGMHPVQRLVVQVLVVEESVGLQVAVQVHDRLVPGAHQPDEVGMVQVAQHGHILIRLMADGDGTRSELEQQDLVEAVDPVLRHDPAVILFVEPRDAQGKLHDGHVKRGDGQALTENLQEPAVLEPDGFLEAIVRRGVQVGGISQAVLHSGVHVGFQEAARGPVGLGLGRKGD